MASTSIAPTPPGTSSKLRAPELLVLPCVRVDPLLWTWLSVVGERYRRESGDLSPNGYNLERVREHWRLGGNSMMLWLLVENGVSRGYAITEILMGARGHECFVPEGYIQPSHRNLGVPVNAMMCFEAWARAHRCRSIKFATFRSDAAYARLLRRGGWHRGETVFVKSLEDTPDGKLRFPADQ